MKRWVRARWDEDLAAMPEVSRHNEPQVSPQEYECGCVAVTRVTDRDSFSDEKPFEMRLAVQCGSKDCELNAKPSELVAPRVWPGFETRLSSHPALDRSDLLVEENATSPDRRQQAVLGVQLTDPVQRIGRAEIQSRADAIARDLLNTSRENAFDRLLRGELSGTLAEPELRILYDMLRRTR